MAYTFWYSGILIGESDLDEPSSNPRQHGGTFRPTAYGLELFPRLTGILTAGHVLKSYLEANDLDPEAMDKRELEQIVDSTPAGQKILDIGRTLSNVEMRSPHGVRLEFDSIAFTDMFEIHTLGRELSGESSDEPIELPPDAPRYIVSATLSGEACEAIGGRRLTRACGERDN